MMITASSYRRLSFKAVVVVVQGIWLWITSFDPVITRLSSREKPVKQGPNRQGTNVDEIGESPKTASCCLSFHIFPRGCSPLVHPVFPAPAPGYPQTCSGRVPWPGKVLGQEQGQEHGREQGQGQAQGQRQGQRAGQRDLVAVPVVQSMTGSGERFGSSTPPNQRISECQNVPVPACVARSVSA